jgi:hypothetical protein
MFCVAGYAQRHADELNGDVPNYVGDSPGGTLPQWPAPGVAPNDSIARVLWDSIVLCFVWL